jgi:SAM-dependent methyltransferase
VSDLFGYHALQMGLPELDGLRANRMPHRWLASDGPLNAEPRVIAPPRDKRISTRPLKAPIGLHCDAEALPFPSGSLDLVVMPHTLELAQDPHAALAEASRVLMPGGRLAIVGLNPASLWGLRQRLGRTRVGLGVGDDRLFLPSSSEFIGYWRLRDWLKLLGFEVEAARFGCYRPPWNSDKWLARAAWMERAGGQWWPVLGAVYFLVAVRRVRGMRLIGRVRKERVKASGAPAVVANRER